MPAGLNDRVFETTADLFGLLAAPACLRIACALVDGERIVSELLGQVAVRQPNMSQHLGTLYRGRVLTRRRAGAPTSIASRTSRFTACAGRSSASKSDPCRR